MNERLPPDGNGDFFVHQMGDGEQNNDPIQHLELESTEVRKIVTKSVIGGSDIELPEGVSTHDLDVAVARRVKKATDGITNPIVKGVVGDAVEALARLSIPYTWQRQAKIINRAQNGRPMSREV